MLRFLVEKPGITVLLAVFLALALSACSSSSGVSQSELDDAEQTATDLAAAAAERKTAQDAINAARTVVAGLTTASDTDAVAAAQTAINAATTAIVDTTLLPAEEVTELNGQVTVIQGQLDNTEEEIANAGEEAMRQEQRTTAQTAIKAARTVVAGLTTASDTDAVAAGQTAINAATTAIVDTTLLPAEEVTELNGQVGDIQKALDSLNETIVINKKLATDLLAEQEKASDAAGKAMTAADNAATSVKAANMARVNMATIQTNEKSSGYETKTQDHAKLANDEYLKADTASKAAAAATTLADAVEARIKAEDARDAAQGHETMAGEYSEKTVMAASQELKIDELVKSVGETEINAASGAYEVTISGQTKKTGLVGKATHAVAEVMGVVFVANTGTTADVAYVQAVEAGSIDIGKTVDSADDTARLMIVTTYAGSRMVKVYSNDPAEANEDTTTAGKMSVIDGDDGDRNTEDDTYVNLRLEGTYYRVEGANDELDALDVLMATAEPQDVYSFMDVGLDGNVGGTDDVKKYVVLETTSTTGDVTTLGYDVVDVMVDSMDKVDPDGNAEEGQVTARLAEATDYTHIHFGVWAALPEAKKDGSQATMADLGIGFVQNVSGEEMTGADMPNNGGATYSGDWVATVRAADDDGNGDITLKHGAATLEAEFGDGEITANLTGLATLTGDITGNEFSGTEAAVITNTVGLTNEADFEGTFSGGFFGSQAAEAGGIFNFTSKAMEAGEFSGAFGADRDRHN